MAADVIFHAGVRVEDLDPGRVDIPIRKSRFLAPPGRALLVDLTCDRKHVRRAQCADLAQRRPVERHVVVHQERPVIPNALEPFVNGCTESQRLPMVHPFQLRIFGDDFIVDTARRAVGNDHDLGRLVDRIQRFV